MADALRSYLVVGHITRDVVGDTVTDGGTALYAAAVATALGYKVRVVTSFAAEAGVATPPVAESECLCGGSRYELGTGSHVVPARSTTTFAYDWGVDGERIQRMTARAEILGASDIPSRWLHSDVWHLAPVAQEINADIVDVIPTESFVGVTPQGWLRAVGDDHIVHSGPWLSSERVSKRANAMVLSRGDLPDFVVAVREWSANGCVIAVTAAEHGATIYWSGHSVHISAFPATVTDELGAGDTFAVAFFDQLSRGGSPLEAGRFASAAASLSVTRHGPYDPPALDDIESALKIAGDSVTTSP